MGAAWALGWEARPGSLGRKVEMGTGGGPRGHCKVFMRLGTVWSEALHEGALQGHGGTWACTVTTDQKEEKPASASPQSKMLPLYPPPHPQKGGSREKRGFSPRGTFTIIS